MPVKHFGRNHEPLRFHDLEAPQMTQLLRLKDVMPEDFWIFVDGFD
jgi:hypothetical protein